MDFANAIDAAAKAKNMTRSVFIALIRLAKTDLLMKSGKTLTGMSGLFMNTMSVLDKFGCPAHQAIETATQSRQYQLTRTDGRR